MVKRKGTDAVKYTALVGVMAATIECAKLALSALPNIELVSILIALFSYIFGFVGFLSSVIFVCIEPLIWGVGTWIISYFIYWPILSITFVFLGRRRIENRFLIALSAVLLTLFFGVLTSLVDIGLFSGSFDNFFYRFSVYYLRGVWFYILHVSSNAVLFFFLFFPLKTAMAAAKSRIFSR